MASVLLDKSRGSTMDKISRVFALKKRFADSVVDE